MLKAVLISSNPEIAEFVGLACRLRWPDASVATVASLNEGFVKFEEISPDIVFLDPNFTGKSHPDVMRALPIFCGVPILVLDNQVEDMKAVKFLESGADDYVRLPCDLAELMARTGVLLRRVKGISGEGLQHPIVTGNLMIDPNSYEVFLDSSRVALTVSEFRILYKLVMNTGNVVTHQALENSLHRMRSDDYCENYAVVKKYIQRIRKKLGDDPQNPQLIVSVHGVGYRFIGPAAKPLEYAVLSGSKGPAPWQAPSSLPEIC